MGGFAMGGLNNPVTALRVVPDIDSQRAMFELFVMFHRHHQAQPSMDYEYAIGYDSDPSGTYLILTRVQSRDQIMPGAAAFFLHRDQVAAYIAEIGQWNAGRGAHFDES